MLSCRSVKGPLIFVSVLMHRETNFAGGERGDNRGTKCPDPKRCWTESNSAFSFARTTFFSPIAQQPASHAAHAVISCVRRGCLSLRRLSFSPFPHNGLLHALRAYPVSARRTRPLHSPFADQAVGNTVGSSPTSRIQKAECGLMRSAARMSVRCTRRALRRHHSGRSLFRDRFPPGYPGYSLRGACPAACPAASRENERRRGHAG